MLPETTEVAVIIKGGIVRGAYSTKKGVSFRLIDLDETDPECLEQLKDEAYCVSAEWYDIY